MADIFDRRIALRQGDVFDRRAAARAPLVLPEIGDIGGSLPEDLYHAIGRGGIKGIAAVPGTLATLMEAGERMPGAWAPSIPEVTAKRQQTTRDLRKKAAEIYKLSDAEVLRAKRGGVSGWAVNIIGESIPQFGVSAVAAMLGGPAGVVATSAAMGGEEVYQNLRNLGVSHEQANTTRWVTAPIIGLIEKWQIDGVLRIGNKALKRQLIAAARERAFKKMAVAGGKMTLDHALKAAGEGLQETLEEGVGIGAEVALARDFDPKTDLSRLGGAFVGGAFVGEALHGGISAARGGASLVAEAQRQSDVAVTEKMAVQQELQPPSVDEPIEIPDLPEPEPAAPRSEVVPPVGSEAGPDVVEDVTEPPVVQPETGADPERPYMATRNADMEIRSQWMGNPPVPEQIPAGTTAARRQAAIDGGYDQRAPDIANDILNDPRPATAEETHGLGIRAEQLESEHDRMAEQLESMADDNPDRTTLIRRMDELEEQHGVITKVLRWAGTEWHAAGYARQHRLGDNGNALNVIGRAIKAAGGKQLSEDTKADFRQRSRKLQRRRKRAKASVQRDAKSFVDRMLSQARDKQSKYSRMSETEKDAELEQLLSRERTDLVIYNATMNIASRMEGKGLEAVTRRVLEHFPDMERSDLTDAIVRATERRAQNTDSMVQYLRSLRRKYRKVRQLRDSIADVLYWMEQGRLPDKPEPTMGGIPDPVIRKLQSTLDNLKKLQRDSDAAEQQRLERRIAFLKARLASQDFDTTRNVRSNKPSNRTLQLQYEVARLDHEISRQIHKQRSVDPIGHTLGEAARTVMALKSSFDLSALGNQGGWVLLSHPLRTAATLPRVLRAAASDKNAFEINAAIRNRTNAPNYFRDGLELTEVSEADSFTEREELFRSEWATKIPVIGRGIAASNRAFATTLNLLRADSYDAMAAAFADEGGPTVEEGRAIADFVNMATGRGVVRGAGMKQMMNRMNGIFWAPRRALSRFQMVATLGGQLEYRHGKWMPIGLRGSKRVRRMFAKELGRYLAGLATVYFLGQLAGGELEADPRSSDLGKIRFGDTRLDPLSGMSQTLVLLGRMTLKERKNQYGGIDPLTGYDLERTVGQFLKNKVSPAFTIAWAGYTGDTPFDGPTTLLWAAKESVMPIALDDIYKVMRDQGVPRGTILSMLGILGLGVQVYGDSTGTAGAAPTRGVF